MIVWNDLLLAETIVSQNDVNKTEGAALSEDGKKYCNRWAEFLIRYHIYISSDKKDTDGYLSYITENEKYIKETLDKYITNKSKGKKTERIQTIYNNMKKGLEEQKEKKEPSLLNNNRPIDDNKFVNDRVFFNDKPIVIYVEEAEIITKLGERYNYTSKDGLKPCEVLQRYLLVWLVYQKAYQNRFLTPKEWVPVKDDELFAYAEKAGESGHRCDNFRKLIESGYLSYDIKPRLEQREKHPIGLYKVKDIKYSGDIAFIITDFDNIFLHYKKYIGGKVKECPRCHKLFEFIRDSKELCKDCAKKKKNEQTNSSKKKTK